MEIGIDTFVTSYDSGLTDSNEKAIAQLLERISYADSIGLDVYGIGEHHGKNMLDSAPTMLLAAAAAQTKRIRLTSAVTGLGTADPVRVFQNFATLDLISKGRAEIVVGRGASMEAFSLFGFNIRDSAELFSEKLELLLKIRGNEFITWSGRFRSQINNMAIYPRPVQGLLPIWHGVLRTPASFIRAGELGLPLMLATIDGQIEPFRSLIALYREAGRDAGFNPHQLRVGLHSMGYVADNMEQAINDFYPGYVKTMTELHGSAITKSRFDMNISSKGGTLLLGSPEEVAAKILQLSEDLGGISRFCFQMDYGALQHEKLLKSIELIGNKIIPIIKNKKV